jgi:hypothetical protein
VNDGQGDLLSHPRVLTSPQRRLPRGALPLLQQAPRGPLPASRSSPSGPPPGRIGSRPPPASASRVTRRIEVAWTAGPLARATRRRPEGGRPPRQVSRRPKSRRARREGGEWCRPWVSGGKGRTAPEVFAGGDSGDDPRWITAADCSTPAARVASRSAAQQHLRSGITIGAAEHLTAVPRGWPRRRHLLVVTRPGRASPTRLLKRRRGAGRRGPAPGTTRRGAGPAATAGLRGLSGPTVVGGAGPAACARRTRR